MSTALPWHFQKLPHDPHWDVRPGWDLGRAGEFWALAKDGWAESSTWTALCLAGPTTILAFMSSAPFFQGQTFIL